MTFESAFGYPRPAPGDLPGPDPAILALSALLTSTMPEFRAVIEGIERAGLRGKGKILVGGAPITEQYATSVGADA